MQITDLNVKFGSSKTDYFIYIVVRLILSLNNIFDITTSSLIDVPLLRLFDNQSMVLSI